MEDSFGRVSVVRKKEGLRNGVERRGGHATSG